MKRPSFQFYPGDWLHDTALRVCSVGARGLWIDMLSYMHQGSPYGHLKVNGKVILPYNLARMVGATLPEVEGWLQELQEAGVYSVLENSCIYSRRMIRDEDVRQKRVSGGKLGGNPKLMGERLSSKVNHQGNHSNVKKDKQKTTPSSSSSSSSSSSLRACTTPASFERAWANYPKRNGGNSKADALKAWSARISAGVSEEDIERGVQRYHDYCRATGDWGTKFVKQASTFFGPGLHFQEAWEISKDQPNRSDRNGQLQKPVDIMAKLYSDIAEADGYQPTDHNYIDGEIIHNDE